MNASERIKAMMQSGLLGRKSDREVGEQFGLSRRIALECRNRMGIKPFVGPNRNPHQRNIAARNRLYKHPGICDDTVKNLARDCNCSVYLAWTVKNEMKGIE